MTKRKANPFANRKATVSLHRNGLSIEIQEVAASDSGAVAKELLDMMRTLIAAGYEELVQDTGGVHGGAFGEVHEYEEEWINQKKGGIGFTA